MLAASELEPLFAQAYHGAHTTRSLGSSLPSTHWSLHGLKYGGKTSSANSTRTGSLSCHHGTANRQTHGPSNSVDPNNNYQITKEATYQLGEHNETEESMKLMGDLASTYGEISFAGAQKMFHLLNQEAKEQYVSGDAFVGKNGSYLRTVSLGLTAEDVFFDLGSGLGKLVTQAFLSTPCNLCVGVELGERRHGLALLGKQQLLAQVLKMDQEHRRNVAKEQLLTDLATSRRNREEALLAESNRKAEEGALLAETNRKARDSLREEPLLPPPSIFENHSSQENRAQYVLENRPASQNRPLSRPRSRGLRSGGQSLVSRAGLSMIQGNGTNNLPVAVLEKSSQSVSSAQEKCNSTLTTLCNSSTPAVLGTSLSKPTHSQIRSEIDRGMNACGQIRSEIDQGMDQSSSTLGGMVQSRTVDLQASRLAKLNKFRDIAQKMEKGVEFRHEDISKTDIEKATIVYASTLLFPSSLVRSICQRLLMQKSQAVRIILCLNALPEEYVWGSGFGATGISIPDLLVPGLPIVDGGKANDGLVLPRVPGPAHRSSSMPSFNFSSYTKSASYNSATAIRNRRKNADKSTTSTNMCDFSSYSTFRGRFRSCDEAEEAKAVKAKEEKAIAEKPAKFLRLKNKWDCEMSWDGTGGPSSTTVYVYIVERRKI